MTLTYKYRLKGKRAARRLRRMAWGANQTWNFCVATQRAAQRRWKEGASSRWPSRFDLGRLIAGTSATLGIHSDSQEAVCHRFTSNRDQHRRCPRFRASGGAKRALGWIPFKCRGGVRVAASSIAYLGQELRWFASRPLPSKPATGQFVEDASGRWWVCLQVEVEDHRATGSGEIGVDLGLKHLAVTSQGERVEAIRSYRQLEAKLGTAQRAGNRTRVRAIHCRIKNVRADHLHKTSARLAAANRLIAVGNVRPAPLARTRFAKSVLDAGWSAFRTMLRYKASRHGATYVEVDERFTTQACSRCGVIPDSSPKGIGALGIREWVCSSCGASHDRDVNAATNILAIGRGAAPRDDENRAACGRQPGKRNGRAGRFAALTPTGSGPTTEKG